MQALLSYLLQAGNLLTLHDQPLSAEDLLSLSAADLQQVKAWAPIALRIGPTIPTDAQLASLIKPSNLLRSDQEFQDFLSLSDDLNDLLAFEHALVDDECYTWAAIVKQKRQRLHGE